MFISLSPEVASVLLKALRQKGERQILTDDEYDALLHTAAKLRENEKLQAQEAERKKPLTFVEQRCPTCGTWVSQVR